VPGLSRERLGGAGRAYVMSGMSSVVERRVTPLADDTGARPPDLLHRG
jgi:hypothetical protein